MSIYAQPFGAASERLLKVGTVDASGNLTATYTAPVSTTFTAVFSGDALYSPATVTMTVYVRDKVSESISGYYGSRQRGGTTYRLYHRTQRLLAHATVLPKKAGECVQFEVQEFYLGAWHPNVVSTCVRLSGSSMASGAFLLSKADIGYPYRVRADITGDGTNAAGSSVWIYIMVEK